MNRKAVLITLSILVTLGFVALGTYFLHDALSYTPTDELWIHNIEVHAGAVTVDGGTSSSAMGYVGYRYNLQSDSVFIRVKYVLVSKRNPSGNFHIEITGSFMSIKKIFLQGAKGDTKLIWENGAPVD
jgi:hypothetical protein